MRAPPRVFLGMERWVMVAQAVEAVATKGLEPVWSVWRRDENGNHFLVQEGLTQSDAWGLVRAYEQKGHKQLYWAKATQEYAPPGRQE